MVGESLLNVAVYMADARELQLELVGGGEHDWNEVFYGWGLLAEDSVDRISTATYHLGVLVMLAATAWLACLSLPARSREALASKAAGMISAPDGPGRRADV